MLNNFDRDNFLERSEGVAFCLLALVVSVISIFTPVLAECNSKSVLLSLSVFAESNGGDAIRRLLGFPESESDALPSDSSCLGMAPGYAMRLLPDFPDSVPESSLFLSMPKDGLPRLLDLEESDSYSRPSESSWLLSTLDWESDLSNEGRDLSETESNDEYEPPIQRFA